MLHFGTLDYGYAHSIQLRLLEGVSSGRVEGAIMFLEHPDVYTAGIHTSPEDLGNLGEAVRVERGGSVTYHGPGQLVTYYILNLIDLGINVRDLVQKVEEAVVSTLARFSIRAEGRLGRETGVWVGSRKICSIGFALRSSVTFHGSALNISTDLSKFGVVNPCGFSPSVMTSMEAETGRKIERGEVEAALERELLASLGIGSFRDEYPQGVPL